MTQRPNENFFTTAKTEGESRDGWFIPVQRITGELVGGGESFPTYTIDTGTIKPQVALFDVATEGGAGTDDLSQASISFDPGDGSTFVVPEGRVIILKANNDAQTVVIKHEAGGSGQFSLTNEEDLSLTTTKQSVAFRLVGTTWEQITFHDDPYLTKYYNFVDYPVGWRVVGSDYKIYRCLIANGPSSSVVSPISDTTSTWVLDLDDNTYSAYIDYVVGKRVIGSDGNEYKCLIANGPATSTVNPVGDTTGTWGNNWQSMHVQDQKTSGTEGGTLNSGSRATRILNTVVKNTIPGASLSSNQITLPIGVYKISAHTVGYQIYGFKAWIHNITDATDIIVSTSGYTSGADGVATIIYLYKEDISITATKVIELQIECTVSKATVGLGKASGLDVEIYSDIYIERMDG